MKLSTSFILAGAAFAWSGSPTWGRSGGNFVIHHIAAARPAPATVTVAHVRKLGFEMVDAEIRYGNCNAPCIVFPAVFFGPKHIYGEPIFRRYRCAVPEARQTRHDWTHKEMTNWRCRKLPT